MTTDNWTNSTIEAWTHLTHCTDPTKHGPHNWSFRWNSHPYVAECLGRTHPTTVRVVPLKTWLQSEDPDTTP